MQFMMPEHALPEDAEVAVLLGLHQRIGGPWKLIYLFRRLRCLHIYECVSQGREWWFSLHLTTDARYSLREMQPSWQNRQVSPLLLLLFMNLFSSCYTKTRRANLK